MSWEDRKYKRGNHGDCAEDNQERRERRQAQHGKGEKIVENGSKRN